MSPAIPSSNATTNQTGATAPTAPATDPLANESTFLKLLVSQLQNQDPLNPTDSTQFVSQLTSYSQLEQLINIDKNTAAASATGTTNSTAPTGTTPTGTTSTTGN